MQNYLLTTGLPGDIITTEIKKRRAKKMKAYEIYVTTVSEDWGREIEDERIAIVSTKEKVAEKIADFRTKNEIHQFWMAWATEKVDGKERIRFKVKEIEID